MRCSDDRPAWVSGQVADKRGLKIDSLHHNASQESVDIFTYYRVGLARLLLKPQVVKKNEAVLERKHCAPWAGFPVANRQMLTAKIF